MPEVVKEGVTILVAAIDIPLALSNIETPDGEYLQNTSILSVGSAVYNT